jgi:hypothetical protein
MRNWLPDSHSKVVRARGPLAGSGANEELMLHSPTKTSRDSSVCWGLVSINSVSDERVADVDHLQMRTEADGGAERVGLSREGPP